MRRNQNFEKVTYVFRLFDFLIFFFSPFLFLLFFSFCCSDWPSTKLASSLKTFWESIIKTGNFCRGVATRRCRKFCSEFFTQLFWAFLCISQAPLGRSLWSGYHWKDLSLLQKLSIDDANFGQGWWRQKWKKAQGSSWPVTAGTGVNGLINFVI